MATSKRFKKAVEGLDRGKTYSVEEAVKLIDRNQCQLDRITRMVDEMLDITHIHSGKLEIVKARMDLSSAAAEVVERFSAQISSSGSEFRSHIEKGVQIRADSARVEQMILNLLSNAVKYGEGKAIEFRLEACEGGARISVKDHGMGIAPEVPVLNCDPRVRLSVRETLISLTEHAKLDRWRRRPGPDETTPLAPVC